MYSLCMRVPAQDLKPGDKIYWLPSSTNQATIVEVEKTDNNYIQTLVRYDGTAEEWLRWNPEQMVYLV
jgi:hypothetical protein